MRLSFAFVSVLLAGTSVASPQSGVVGWGLIRCDSHWNEEQFASVAAGARFTIATRANGTLAAWGFNYEGQCIVPALPPAVSYTQVSASTFQYDAISVHVLALRSDGLVNAWGGNLYGQCNVPPLPPAVFYSGVSTGDDFSLALRSDGTLAAWGNTAGGLSNLPVAPPGTAFTAVSAGGYYGLALRSDGIVVAWGANVPLGILNVPALPAGQVYVDISAGGTFALARRIDGTVVAWGSNTVGQCNVPSLPAGMTYTRMDAGMVHALALRSDGALLAWGSNLNQQCDVPAPPPGLSYDQVAAGSNHSVALRSDGIAVAWGSNAECQCNVPALPPGVTFEKIVGSGPEYPNLVGAGRGEEYLALRSDGQLSRWGSNYGTIPALPAGTTWTQVGPGVTNAAIRSDGALVNWGGMPAPPALPPGVKYTSLAGGLTTFDDQCTFHVDENMFRVLACRSDGVLLKVFGNCQYFSCTPNPLPAGLSYDQVSTSGVHVLARRSDGSVVGWGDATYGESSLPALPAGVTYVDIAAGGGSYFVYDCSGLAEVNVAHSLGLRSDGWIEGSGSNAYGQLNVPPLLPAAPYVEIGVGTYFSVARRADGSVAAWGHNAQHQLDVPGLGPGETYTGIAVSHFSAVASYETAPPCGSVSTYCSPARPNSASAQGAQMTTQGCPGLTANDLVIDVTGLPPSKMGMFLYSSAQQQVSFGNGWGCVAGGIQRVYPTILSSPTGTVSYPVDLTQFPYTGSAHAIQAGSAWNFQFWFRDPGVPPSQFNLSDALHISFAP